MLLGVTALGLGSANASASDLSRFLEHARVNLAYSNNGGGYQNYHQGYAQPMGYAPQYGYAPQNGYAPQYGYAPQNGYAPQTGYAPQYGFAPQNGYGPQYGGYGPVPQVDNSYGSGFGISIGSVPVPQWRGEGHFDHDDHWHHHRHHYDD